MNSLISTLNSKNIVLTLKQFDSDDAAFYYEAKIIADNSDIFNSIFENISLDRISCIDEYILFLFAIKFSKANDIISLLDTGDSKDVLLHLANSAQNFLSKINIGSIVKYIFLQQV